MQQVVLHENDTAATKDIIEHVKNGEKALVASTKDDCHLANVLPCNRYWSAEDDCVQTFNLFHRALNFRISHLLLLGQQFRQFLRFFELVFQRFNNSVQIITYGTPKYLT